MMKKWMVLLLVLVLCTAPFTGLAMQNSYYVVEGMLNVVECTPGLTGASPEVYDQKLSTSVEAVWAGNMPELLHEEKYFTKDGVRWQFPYISFMGTGGQEGEISCTYQFEGASREDQFQLIPSGMKHNGELEKLENLATDKGMYVLLAAPGEWIDVPNFLECTGDGIYSYWWSGAGPIKYNEPLHYQVQDGDHGKRLIMYATLTNPENPMETERFTAIFTIYLTPFATGEADSAGSPSSDETSVPQTGDSSAPLLWGTLLSMSLCGMVLLAVRRGRKANG